MRWPSSRSAEASRNERRNLLTRGRLALALFKLVGHGTVCRQQPGPSLTGAGLPIARPRPLILCLRRRPAFAPDGASARLRRMTGCVSASAPPPHLTMRRPDFGGTSACTHYLVFKEPTARPPEAPRRPRPTGLRSPGAGRRRARTRRPLGEPCEVTRTAHRCQPQPGAVRASLAELSRCSFGTG